MTSSDRYMVFNELRGLLDVENAYVANTVRSVLPIISEELWNELLKEKPGYIDDVYDHEFNEE